jgi:hypothetical protein
MCHVQRIATRVMQMIKASRKSSSVFYPPLLRLLHVSGFQVQALGLTEVIRLASAFVCCFLRMRREASISFGFGSGNAIMRMYDFIQ